MLWNRDFRFHDRFSKKIIKSKRYSISNANLVGKLEEKKLPLFLVSVSFSRIGFIPRNMFFGTFIFNKMIMGGAFLLLTQIFVSNFKKIFAQGNIN